MSNQASTSKATKKGRPPIMRGVHVQYIYRHPELDWIEFENDQEMEGPLMHKYLKKQRIVPRNQSAMKTADYIINSGLSFKDVNRSNKPNVGQHSAIYNCTQNKTFIRKTPNGNSARKSVCLYHKKGKKFKHPTY